MVHLDRRGYSWIDRIGLFLLLAAFVWTGCTGSGSTREGPSTETAADTSRQVAPGSGLRAIAVGADGLVYREGEAEPTVLAPAEEFLGARAASPDGRYVTAAVREGDSTKLLLVDRQRPAVRTLDARAGRMNYSAAWAPDGSRVAYGYYRRTAEDGWGAGGIRVAELGGSTRSVGCQSVREVLDWLPDGNLAVRTPDDLFVVDSADCGTVSSVDARRLFHLTYSPRGRRLAYIYRELVYRDEIAEYVPDSTLFVADPSGQNREEVVGDSYRARHFDWSPDGTELAFDARSQEDSTRRQVIVYDVTNGRLTYLVPPSQGGSAGQLHPRWSPEGDRVAYTVDRAAGRFAAVRDVGQTRVLGEVAGAIWGWVDARTLVVPGSDTTRVFEVDGGDPLTTYPASWSLLAVWRTAPS